MAGSEQLARELEGIQLEIHEAARERDGRRLLRLQKRREIIRKQLEQAQVREKQGRMGKRLRDSVPLWTLLTLFVAAFSGLLVAPLADTPLERHGTSLRLLALGGIVFCLVVGILAPFVDVLRTVGRYLGRSARALAALVARNMILAVSSLFTAGLILLLAIPLGQGGAAAIALGLVVTNAGITVGIVRLFGPRVVAASSVVPDTLDEGLSSRKDRGTITTYRRKNGRDIWHWCRNCPHWPISHYEEITTRGRPSSGELHNGCLAKERTGTCSK